MDFGLTGKVVLVTGGSDGLGAALVRTLAAEGAHVAFCGRNQDRITAVADAVTAAGGDVLGVRADVTDGSELQTFVAAAHDRWGRVDGLVNNAGTSSAIPFDQQTDSDWDEDLDLKVRAAIRAIRLVLPFMRSGGGGSIVNVLAIAARAPAAGSTPTSVSRAAGLALTKALSKELGPELIRVNAILVGMVQSGQWDKPAGSRSTSSTRRWRTPGRSRWAGSASRPSSPIWPRSCSPRGAPTSPARPSTSTAERAPSPEARSPAATTSADRLISRPAGRSCRARDRAR